ncbi:peroxiredoxin-like family protein [Salinibacterium sp. ZJ450]|uniref:peroxiredoxin-like family protein n=1 Tax=Salinibacterium sp. ZJ450 TaxID=2708338 RepID=UPI00141EB281|nr:peroxiredoxin-like family protein [Salinibacterium sp. ZJ450]
MMSTVEEQIEAAEREWLDAWHRGPERLRWDRVPLQLGDPAPDLELLDHTGESVHLATFWEQSPALLLFWRHFGCSCGLDRAARLTAEYDQYLDAGASVVVIGQGEPARAAEYRDRTGIPCPILCDPDRASYRSFDLLEGTSAQILFDSPDEFLRCDPAAGESLAASRHGTSRATVDSPWQLPGEFVIGHGGVVQLAYRYQYCEDWPDPRVLTAAIRFGGFEGGPQ